MVRVPFWSLGYLSDDMPFRVWWNYLILPFVQPFGKVSHVTSCYLSDVSINTCIDLVWLCYMKSQQRCYNIACQKPATWVKASNISRCVFGIMRSLHSKAARQREGLEGRWEAPDSSVGFGRTSWLEPTMIYDVMCLTFERTIIHHYSIIYCSSTKKMMQLSY